MTDQEMAEKSKTKPNKENLTCGIVMPISGMEGLPEKHWSDVRSILDEAIEDAGLEPHLVSDADDIGIIQKRIIQSLFRDPILVCDVSGKNPNVMFELGMRLAFDKPTVIVKDDKTDYSFDTAPIEHLTYPRDLRFNRIIEFKEELASKLKGTVKASSTDPEYTTFLKHFGTFKIAELDSEEVSGQELLLNEMQELKSSFARSQRTNLGGLRGRAAFDAFERMAHYINIFARENKIKTKKEARERWREFYEFIEKTLPVHRYFDRRSEFREAFDIVFQLIY